MTTPRKRPEDLLKRGAPTAYRPEFCQQLLDYFGINEALEQSYIPIGENGTKVVFKNHFPTIEGFADSIGHTAKVLREWRDRHPEFGAAYERALGRQAQIMIQGAMHGIFAGAFPIFAAKNILGWRDKFEHTGPGGGPIQQVISRDEANL